MRTRWLGLALAGVCAASCAWGTKVYPFPQDEPESKRFSVMVDGRKSGVYVAHVKCVGVVGTATAKEQMLEGEAAFTPFEIAGKARVVVTVPEKVMSVKVLPSRWKIVPKVRGNTVTFDVTEPGQYTVEVNGDWNNSLEVFADAPEVDVPREGDPNVIFFGPGVHVVDPIYVTSGKTVYLAPGAVVYGKEKQGAVVLHLHGDNITVRGRGIVDDSLTPRTPQGGETMVVEGNHVRVEGITLRDSGTWSLHVRQSKDVVVEGVKIFGWRDNSDGIDVNNSQDVKVSGGFIRTFDDLVVVKTTSSLSQDRGAQPTERVDVRKMVLWNTLAHALSLGAEVREPIRDVVFADCDVIHDKGREWVLRVYNTDAGTASHVVFENIRVEEAQRLSSVWIGKAIWSKDAERGRIEDVVFRDIVAPKGLRAGTQNEVVGADAEHVVKGVVYQNVMQGGRPLNADDVSNNGFSEGVRFTK